MARNKTEELKVERALKLIRPLRLKSAAVLASAEEYTSGSPRDFEAVYIHGVILSDISKTDCKEFYLVSKNLNFRFGEIGTWVDRKNILTLKEVKRFNLDKKDYRMKAKVNALIAEIDAVRKNNF